MANIPEATHMLTSMFNFVQYSVFYKDGMCPAFTQNFSDTGGLFLKYSYISFGEQNGVFTVSR
jgi:hypothetical protein